MQRTFAGSPARGQGALQPLKLLLPDEALHFTRHPLLRSAEPRPYTAGKTCQPSNDGRRPGDRIGPRPQLPQGVVAERVVLPAQLESGVQAPLLGRANLPVVEATLLGKRPRRPSPHARRDHGDVVDPATFDRGI